jgi:SWI/SNF-related matrix-associated actin-dependent regulator 1 of chromatin subfamily A
MDTLDLKSAISYLLDVHKSFRDMGDELLQKEEYAFAKNLSRIPDEKWNDGLILKGLKFLFNQQDFFDADDFNIDFSILEELEKIKNDKKFVSFENGQFKLSGSSTILPDDISNKYFNYLDVLVDLKYVDNYLFNKDSLKILNKSINLRTIETHGFLTHYDRCKKIIMDYQKQGIGFLLINGKSILADDKGLGKTLQALVSVDYIDSYPCVVVCPNTLKYNWYKEIDETLYDKVINVPNSPKEFDLNSDFIIVNYESLHKYKKLINDNVIKTIIFDESHFLKNPKTRRTQTSIELSNNKSFIIEITGTPVFSKPKELISQLNVIDKMNDFGGYWDFLERYCGATETNWGFLTDGHGRLDELSEKLRETCFIRREKEDVLKELPPKQKTVIPVQLTNHNLYAKTFAEYSNTTTSNKKKRSDLLFKLKLMIAEGKLSALEYFVEELTHMGKKCIIFVKYHETFNKVAKLYEHAYKINSDLTPKERVDQTNKFQNHDGPIPIIVSQGVGNAGLDLFAASEVIFLEFDSVDEINEQCSDRAHRIGQKDFVNVSFLVGINSYDEHTYALSQNKKIITDSVKHGYLNGN